MVDSELLRIIGLIYDAVVRPEGWEQALDTIRVRHSWFNSSMAVIGLPAGKNVVSVALNLPDDFHEMSQKHVRDVIELWGGPERVAQLPLEEPILNSNVTDPTRWMENGYFREWGRPHGLVDQVAIGLARDPTAIANISFGIHESTIVTPTMMDELRILAPHLRRAAIIARILENSQTRAATLEAALDATQAGAILVRGDMGIVHANQSAEAMLRQGDPIRAAKGRLRLAEEIVPGHLEAAVQAAANGAAAIGRRGIGIPARRDDGSPLVTHVMPLEGRQGQALDADAVVFVADSGGAEPAPGQSLELLFGLTPAEARAFELVVSGRPSGSIAQAMGVAESTLRTHLLRVFDKTGRHSRAALVQLARELELPV
jgi:DNA-binding CsgD family transcriptional regulator/PAS domain-containing protein